MTGGRFRGRRIESPVDKAVRPTTGLVRESLFSRIAPWLSESRFLDLFAGSGLMGIEALSRGASRVVAVDKNPGHCRLISTNFQTLGLSDAEAQVICKDVMAFVSRPAPQAFDIIFMDPPYGFLEWPRLLALLAENGWMTGDTVVIVEHARRESALEGYDRREYGDTALSIRFPTATEASRTEESDPSSV